MDPALLAPIDADRLAALRSEWAWLVPAELRTIGVSRLGDWLLEGADGVHVLDTVEGRLSRTEGGEWEAVLLEGLAPRPPRITARNRAPPCRTPPRRR